MKFFRKKKTLSNTLADMRRKTLLFGELICAISELNPTLSDEQQLFIGHTSLLAIVDINDLEKIVSIAITEAVNKNEELQNLEDMFNLPSSNNNN